MTQAQANFITMVSQGARQGYYTHGILPSLTIAQAILESGWGNSGLTQISNNLFGMKGSYNGASVNYKTYEYVNGQKIQVTAVFKKYPSYTESMADHARLLGTADRYKNLRNNPDYKSVCRLIAEDGYATSPTYTTSLINIIEAYELFKFDPGHGVTFYNFTTGPITKGDLNNFIELAKALELKAFEYTIIK